MDVTPSDVFSAEQLLVIRSYYDLGLYDMAQRLNEVINEVIDAFNAANAEFAQNVNSALDNVARQRAGGTAPAKIEVEPLKIEVELVEPLKRRVVERDNRDRVIATVEEFVD